MKNVSRRKFLGSALLASGALASRVALPEAHAENSPEHVTDATSLTPAAQVEERDAAIDFRHSPALRQTAFCFPDDRHKSLIHESGRLVYGYGPHNGTNSFALSIEFAMYGMQPNTSVSQTMESPSVPILRTVIERSNATMILTTFATNNADEGRVDNVLIEIQPRQAGPENVSPVVKLHCAEKYGLRTAGSMLTVSNLGTGEVLCVARVFGNRSEGTIQDRFFYPDIGAEQQLTFHPGVASHDKPYRAFLRFPQAKQSGASLQGGLNDPDGQLKAAREFWASWSPFQKPVSWQLSGRQGEFVTACARNILQAREVRNGKLTFQVGATCYRGLWVVDGNFILEAARYLGYDKEAVSGLKTTWSQQQKSGQISASGGAALSKDTAIALFTLVRQCELGQDWTLLREYRPNVEAALQYIDSLRAQSREQGGVLGRYGLLPKGFSDGGLDGIGIEFTNTLWAMAGLKAIGEAGEQQHIPEIARAATMYRELHAGFNDAAVQEMRSYDGKFQYLPMLLKEDPKWQAPDPWDRPRPQSAQWALSHAIFPGRVFDPQHPVLQGHVSLMQAVRQEGIPAETGWIHHEGVWNYNAAFVAEVYLWLGMKQAAHDTFTAFLNHASPQYCWREEQPLKNALIGSYVGDMPHNWASAECIRYVRHILALEDGSTLRLLAGMTEEQLAPGDPYVLQGSPTRFGRVDVAFEPLERKQGWRLKFHREPGPSPAAISVPTALGRRFHLATARNVHFNRDGDLATVDPSMRDWELVWKVSATG
jgi:hypothetical protein